MKIMTFLILCSFLFTCTVAHPAMDSEEVEQYTWLDKVVTSILDKSCLFVCGDSPTLLEQYIPDQLRDNLANAGKDVTKALLKYVLTN